MTAAPPPAECEVGLGVADNLSSSAVEVHSPRARSWPWGGPIPHLSPAYIFLYPAVGRWPDCGTPRASLAGTTDRARSETTPSGQPWLLGQGAPLPWVGVCFGEWGPFQTSRNTENSPMIFVWTFGIP